MKTPMPASPFQYDSVGLHPLPTDEAAASLPLPHPDAAAEIPGALVAPGPAAVPFASPLAAAGDISSSDGRRQSLADGSFLSGSTLGLPDSSETAVAWSPRPTHAAATNSSFTAGGPQRALPAVADPHETGRALGTVPLDYETILKALESCLHEDWIFGIDEPDPMLLFLETFPLNAREQA